MSHLFGKLDEIAIERLKTFEDNALAKHPDGYWLAYSGGKDSDTILDLAERSGVKYTAHHSLTTCDPPEVVRHIKKRPEVTIHRPELSMWKLIVKKGMPPRRQARYCCEALKEGGGAGRLVITGIRWGESRNRSKRRMVETCYRDKTKQFMNIIIDWSTTDVWSYIKSRNIEYCSLYDEGFSRIGCVLCPMSRDVEKQMQRWPRIARGWERAIKATYKPRYERPNKKDGNPDMRCKPRVVEWKDPEEYWQWWLDRDAPSLKKDKDQMLFFSDMS